MKKILLIILFMSAFTAGRTQQSADGAPSSVLSGSSHFKKPKRKVSTEKLHYGTASFYANKFEGRQTANGEIFSQKKLSAASNILPLNNWVRVTNTKNKLSVVLRVIDRMHKNNKRLIDLSRAAARKLKYTGNGLAHVKVEVLGKHLPEGIARD
jgi:rare lipoprotein A